MVSLGVLERPEADVSLSQARVKPVIPGTGGARSGAKPRRAPLATTQQHIIQTADQWLFESVMVARRTAEKSESSTALAALAHALEAASDRTNATEAAKKALQRCVTLLSSHTSDPFAARLAMEVLLRAGETDEVLSYARQLDVGPHMQLEIGAFLAAAGRFIEAFSLTRTADVPEREAIEGYILALKGDYQRAVPYLRSALRRDPYDADTALNLSLSLLGTGARRKARVAAEQAHEASPARADIWFHLLELILADRDIERAEREINTVLGAGIEPSAHFLALRGRLALMKNDRHAARRFLEQARSRAEIESDVESLTGIQSALIRLKSDAGEITREEQLDELRRLVQSFPDNEVALVNFAQSTWLRPHAEPLSAAMENESLNLSPTSKAFISYQISTLTGDNSAAATYASDWYAADPENPQAFTALMITLGIGEERWEEAATLARKEISKQELDASSLNNAAYVLAMAGMGDVAIKLLTPRADENFFLKATLGLAHLSVNDIAGGMRLYRQAASQAEASDDDSRSLMTAYQALIVRQLDLVGDNSELMISALALPHYPLPEDWADRPEFLRLYGVAVKHGYSWPLEL